MKTTAMTHAISFHQVTISEVFVLKIYTGYDLLGNKLQSLREAYIWQKNNHYLQAENTRSESKANQPIFHMKLSERVSGDNSVF